MHLGKLKPAALLAAAALLLEITLCQASFWATLTQKGEDVTERMETVYDYVSMEDMGTAAQENDAVYEDEQGYIHVPEGSVLIKLENLDRDVDRLYLDLAIPKGYRVKADLFVQDEGNGYLYRMGEGRILLREVPQNAWMKLYPYGRVKNLYLRLETADSRGNGAAGELGELICRIDGIRINGRMPFVFRPVRLLVIAVLLWFLFVLRAKSRIHQIKFQAPGRSGYRKRCAAMVLFTAGLLALAALFVQINPACRKNLAPHHAQYQELAVSLSEGKVSVGEADPALLQVENPYDTISLQAGQIPYQADYAYHDGAYYVYFGIVPELLLYLPHYLFTGRALQNYQAVFLFFSGFIIASAGLMYELMKRFFPDLPFFFWGIGVFMLTGSASYFYLLIRPDLYHVPIAASCMFTVAGLWFYLAGLNRENGKALRYAAGSLCMALTAGCRPQFLLFAFLAVPLFWGEVFRERNLFSKKSAGRTAAITLPFAAVGVGIMYYNAIRFGSPMDFGAAYSMTSNDMTHRGFNLERVLYGFWYFLFQPPRLEADFPYLRSAAIETDYLGKMVSESCFGGIFACSMLVWPVFALRRLGRMQEYRREVGLAAVLALTAVVICAADATGAGILQRYSSDISFGLFLAAAIALFAAARQAAGKGVYGVFLCWLKAALLLHTAYLFLILINTDSSVNLLSGNPVLYYTIQAALRW